MAEQVRQGEGQRRAPATRRARLKSSLAIVAVGLALVWTGPILFGPLTYLFVPVLVYLMTRRRFVEVVVYVLLSPLGVYFALGVHDYLRGRGELRYAGLGYTTFHNVDPQLRCPRATSGPRVIGHEWIVHAPYNGAMRLMTGLLGYMRGAYRGPYPTRAQTLDLLSAGAETVALRRLADDLLVLDGRAVRLDPGVGRHLLRGTPYDVLLAASVRGEDVADELAILGPVRGRVWREQCVILRIPSEYPSGGNPARRSESARIVLIDAERGRPFAYYGTGSYHHHYPPVYWRAGRDTDVLEDLGGGADTEPRQEDQP